MIQKKSIPEKSGNNPVTQDTVIPASAEPGVKDMPSSDSNNPQGKIFPIVGIGASAGGLAAFETFFSGMPKDTDPGMAFVLVQHLAPDHKSILSDLVRRYTRMEVFEVKDGVEVKPNCAYIIPPNCDMAFINGSLQLLEPGAPRGLRLPIDFFFRSLAQDQKEKAVCIILSGTGSDGAMGARAVKAEGGMVVVQTPETTEYDGMPRSAIATGMADFILPPEQMAEKLISYAAHAFRLVKQPEDKPLPGIEDNLQKICILLRDRTGHDFSQYKKSTLVRRIERRMAVNQIQGAEDYLRFFREYPAEGQALFRDLLIGVTSFFRDPDAFAFLEETVIPGLFTDKPDNSVIRIWVCGCSTGEEAYSLAILLHEHMNKQKKPNKIQIFATDIDLAAIDQARSGLYPAAIAQDLTPDRLSRFFVQDKKSGVYRIQKEIRDLLIFSEQDVIKDPPFSKLDMISCRNLMIYLNPELQKKLIPLFHFALNPKGILFLGTSESVGEFTTCFETLERKQKIYQKKEETNPAGHPVQGKYRPSFHYQPPKTAPEPGEKKKIPSPDLGELTRETLLRFVDKTAILINNRGESLYIYGRTGKYLEPAEGEAGMNILSMARDGLQPWLTNALYSAVARQTQIDYPNLRVKTNGGYSQVNLSVVPVSAHTDSGAAGLFLAVFEEVPSSSPSLSPPLIAEIGVEDDDTTGKDQKIACLELELCTKEEYLKSTLEEMETSNEELKSANEEMQSMNEELQSTNEELETSKEELQSVNEELATVNTELQNKVSDLTQANNDMNNLLAGTGIATIFVDHQLNIVRFTPSATEMVNLIQTDIGRPVAHIVSNLSGYDSFIPDIRGVLDTLIPRETQVETEKGTCYLMNIRPYRTLENVILGVVITFMDITRQKALGEKSK